MSGPNGRVQEPDVLEREIAPALPSVKGASVDVQVTTAKQFPRSVTSFMRRATEMATLTPEIAASCVYALPRSGKSIEGPSARLAEICASAWGNLRIQATSHEDGDGRFITGRGEAWDVETNVAIGFEVKRRITNTKGETYNDDMIGVTGNAAASIAMRNAIFKAIPKSFWGPIYNECRKVIAGDARTFATRRDELIKAFGVMGVTEQRLCAALDIKGRADISTDHIVTLTGFFTALKDGEMTIEDAFPESGGLGAPQPAQRKSAQAAATPAPASTAAPAAATTAAAPVTPSASPAEPPKPIGRIKAIHARGETGMVVELETGFRAATRDAELAKGVRAAHAAGLVVELSTRPSSDPAKYAPTLEEIQPVDARDPGQEG